MSIEGFAIDEAAVEALDELFHAEEDHEDEHEHEDEAFENSNGYIDNSEGEASGGSVGFSFVVFGYGVGFCFWLGFVFGFLSKAREGKEGKEGKVVIV